MNGAHLHLLLNHAPVFGIFFVVILIAIGFWLKSDAFKTTAMATALAVSVLTLPVMKSGDVAEHIIKKIDVNSKAAIHEHEEAAEFTQWLLYVSGIIAVAGIVFRKRENIKNKTALGLLVVGIFCFIALARTAYLGGYISHAQEFNGQAVGAPTDNDGD